LEHGYIRRGPYGHIGLVASRAEAHMTKTRYWRIEGFDGLDKIFESEVPSHLLSDKQVKELLRRLLCRHLSDDEIVGASVNQKAKRSALLEVRRSMQAPHVIACGASPHYLARLVSP
jgi:hypothetical protein